MRKTLMITDETVINKIRLIRGKRVMIDRDLAKMYRVETKVLNQAVKRKAFPGRLYVPTNKTRIERLEIANQS